MSRRARHLLSTGVVVYTRNIWISELAGILFVSIVGGFLLALSIMIFANEYEMNRLAVAVAEKRSAAITLDNFRQQLFEKAAIADLLDSIAGKRVARNVLVNLAGIVYDNSTQFGYDPLLLLAVIQVESTFKTDARGRFRDGTMSGALGLMQLKPETAREVALQLSMPPPAHDDLLKPEINVVLGIAYLTRMISKFKNFKLGLLAYNKGPAVVRKHLQSNTPIPARYYLKVAASYYALQALQRASKTYPPPPPLN